VLGGTQPKIAAELGISISQVASFEAGKPQLSVLQASVIKRDLEKAGIAFDAEGRATMREGKL
jgi:hypothetical protein